MENRYLIDTQVFIWSMENNKRISKNIFLLLKDQQNLIYFSVASIWEMIIKTSKKKLKTPKNIVEVINLAGFLILPINLKHVLSLTSLPAIHQDPFDRILISQSQTENLTLITSDPIIAKYKIKVLKA